MLANCIDGNERMGCHHYGLVFIAVVIQKLREISDSLVKINNQLSQMLDPERSHGVRIINQMSAINAKLDRQERL